MNMKNFQSNLKNIGDFMFIGFATLLLTSCITNSSKSFAQSKTNNLAGEYDGGRLKISFDSLNTILSGVIMQEINESANSKEYCVAYFYGKMKSKNDSIIKIKMILPNDDSLYQGVISVYSKSLEIKFYSSIFPCQKSIDFLGGEIYTKTKEINYGRFGMVSAQKAKSYKAASLDSLKKAYLVHGDLVQILEEKDEWVYIEYIKNSKFKAWFRKEDFISASKLEGR